MPEMPPESDGEKREAQRILARVERENAGGGLLSTGLGASRIPTPSAEEDWIEHWGTRIGRMVGLAVAAALTIWIVLYGLNLI